MENKYPSNLKELVKPIKFELFVTVIIAVLGSLSLLVVPVAITLAFGYLVSKNMSGFLIFIIVAGLGIVLRQGLHSFSLYYSHIVEAKFRYKLRIDFTDKLSKLPLGFFTTTSSGAIRKLVSTDTSYIHTIIAHGYTELAASVTLPIGCIIIMLIFDWRTALIILAVFFINLIIGIIWMNVKNKEGYNVNDEYEKAQREMAHSTIEIVDGIKEIKNFGISNSLFAKFDDAVKRFTTISDKWVSGSSKAFSFIGSIMQPSISMFIALVVSIFSIYNSWITFDQIIIFLLLSMELPTSLINLAQIGNHLRLGKHSLDEILNIYAKEDQKYKYKPKELVLGDIEFKDVSFGYEKDNLVLNNINCVIPKNKITALVGPSGGGKTTMARLIARFWDTQKGSVRIGDIDIKDLSEKDLLSSISLVFQDISLLRSSVSENIALAKPNASQKEIEEAAKLALIHDRIMQLPNKYDSIIGEKGVVLSGGEKQRVTIARAFLANTPIVILDEATAQADAESEVEIQKAISTLGKNKTVVIIAHRLQSIVKADQILVVGDGVIKESGTHDELVKQNGIYQNMWESQNNEKEVR